MVALKVALVKLVCLVDLVVSSAQQLTFNSAAGAPPARDQLVRYSWSTRADAEAAATWMEEHEVDVWSTKPAHITARLSQQQQDQLAGSVLVPSAVEVLLPSIQDHLDSPTLIPSFSLLHSEAAVANLSTTRLAQLDDSIHDSYHSLDAINQILRSFEQEFEGYAKVISVGFSAEGREILGLKGERVTFELTRADVELWEGS